MLFTVIPSEVPDELYVYRKRRNFKKNSAPFGRKIWERKASSFIIHKHDANRPHYDLRLEIDGVMKSWAVPKGPSLDPRDKRLAIQVEDHPFDYCTFEGAIPEGEHGAGAVIVWDRGLLTLKNGAFGLKHGLLRFELTGEKLNGGFTLVRIESDDDKKNWLLIKDKDAFSNYETDVVRDLPNSVDTGRSIEEVADSVMTERRAA